MSAGPKRLPPRWFVFLATAWGPQKGGINSLNRDLCIALAEERPIPNATTQVRRVAPDAPAVGEPQVAPCD